MIDTRGQTPDSGAQQDILLSVLIPTVTGRRRLYTALRHKLDQQILAHRLEQAVEILGLLDNREKPVGQKRNELIAAAHGRFVVFIDDDDDISNHYLPRIVAAIRDHPGVDCIGIRGFGTRTRFLRPYRTWRFSISLAHKTLRRENNNLFLPPNHLSPIRREIACAYKFPLARVSEDTRWSALIQRDGALGKEYFIDELLYHYRYHILRSYSTTAPQKLLALIKPDWLPRDLPPLQTILALRDRLRS